MRNVATIIYMLVCAFILVYALGLLVHWAGGMLTFSQSGMPLLAYLAIVSAGLVGTMAAVIAVVASMVALGVVLFRKRKGGTHGHILGN